MQFFQKLIGDRVYLSPIDMSDESIEAFTKWLNDPKVTDYLGRTGQLFPKSSERDHLASLAQSKRGRNFCIVTKDEDRLIGTISLEQLDLATRSAVLGIFIGDPDFHSHGYGTEAINLILDYGFHYLNLHSVRLGVLSGNKRARRCYEKVGFKENGRSRDQFFINGQYHDDIHMDILEDEFTGEFIRNKEL